MKDKERDDFLAYIAFTSDSTKKLVLANVAVTAIVALMCIVIVVFQLR